MKKERSWKFNVIDWGIVVVILAVIAFFCWKFLAPDKSIVPEKKGIIRYEVEVPGLEKSMYERIAATIPAQMAASGKLIDGNILSCSATPCEVDYVQVSSPVNVNEIQWVKADPNAEYVTAVFVCEAEFVPDNNLNMVGTQEIRIGRHHYVKSVDIELIGTIIALSKTV